MTYPHRPYGYEPSHCPVMGLVPLRRAPRIEEIPPMPGAGTYPGNAGNGAIPPASTSGTGTVNPAMANDGDGRAMTPMVATIGRISFPVGDGNAQRPGIDDVESMIDYVVATRQGWRASLVMRAFLRWWRNDVLIGADENPHRVADAIIMLLALNQGRDGFVYGYLTDLTGGRETPVERAQNPFFRTLRLAAIALALSPLLLVFAVLMFLEVDQLVSAGQGKLFGFSYDLLFFVGSFGAIGALVSMMTRLGKDVDWADMEPASVFFNFLFRPCLGFCFALIALLALRAGILPIPLDQLHNISDMDQIGSVPGAGQQISIVLVLAFLSGFSERLSSALVRRVEDRVDGASQGNFANPGTMTGNINTSPNPSSSSGSGTINNSPMGTGSTTNTAPASPRS